MYYYENENYPESLFILEKLKEKDRKNIYYQLTLVDVYGKLEMFENQAKLSFYIGTTDPKLYYKYLKIAADIYNEKFDNKQYYLEYNYKKSMKLYNQYSRKYGDN